MNLSEIIASVKQVLPMLKFVASMTPTPYDDQAVAWLERFCTDPNAALDELTAGNSAQIETVIRDVLPLLSTVANYLPFKHDAIVNVLDFLTSALNEPELFKARLVA